MSLVNFFGNLSPFEILVSVFAIVTGIYTFYKNFIEDARVSAHTGDVIGFVVPPNDGVRKIQLMISLVNHGTKIGTVERLELSLLTPKDHIMYFDWNLFFKYSDMDMMVLVPDTDPYPIAIPPKSTIPRFVEFKLRDKEVPIIWEEGQYSVELYGWVNCTSRTDQINLRHIFHFQLSGEGLNVLEIKRQQAIKQLTSQVGRLPVLEWSSKAKN